MKLQQERERDGEREGREAREMGGE